MSELALAVFAAARDEHATERETRSHRFARFRQSFDAAAYLSELEESGLRWLSRQDGLFPRRVRSIHDPPPGIFLRGAASPELLSAPSVAVVGARSCTDYGAHVARSLGRELAAAGVVVVSGLARGIDGWAHRGALEATGKTVAVLGCGIDRDYPRAHAPLAKRIAESGLLVSEYPPGVVPGAVAVPGEKSDRRRPLRGDCRGRGARAKWCADHGRPRARGGPRGARGSRRDHIGPLERHERADPPRGDSGHSGSRTSSRRSGSSSARPAARSVARRRCRVVLAALDRRRRHAGRGRHAQPGLASGGGRGRAHRTRARPGLVEARAGVYRR